MNKIKVSIGVLFAGMLMTGLSFSSAAVDDSFRNDAAGKTTARPGKQIRQVILKGYTVTYRLLDLSERGEMVKAMGHHSVIGMSKSSDITNHLMVYIRKIDGKAVPGEAAYALTAPDGKAFRTMTMGMYGGYGADINMKLKGDYTIRTIIITEGGAASMNLDDEFVFQVK